MILAALSTARYLSMTFASDRLDEGWAEGRDLWGCHRCSKMRALEMPIPTRLAAQPPCRYKVISVLDWISGGRVWPPPDGGDHEMKNEILTILEVECELKATPASSDRLTDLGVDSLAIVCAVQALEDRFNIDIPVDTDLSEFRTVGDIVAAVERVAENANAGANGPRTGSS